MSALQPAAAPVAPLDLSRPLRLHVVGVGGPGMSAIAIALAEMGHTVSGSDLRDQPVLDRVRAAGRRRSTSATTRPSSSGATPSRRRRRSPTATSSCGPPASTASRRCAGPGCWPRSAPRPASVAVAGTHGKTTTTSMLMLILAEAGMAPSFIVGGDVTDAGTGAHWTGGEWLVVEADESDATHLELPLHATILTNVELDFLEHYGSFEALVDGFDRYLARSPARRSCAPTTRWPPTGGAPRRGHLRARRDADFRAVDVRSVGGSFRFAVERGAGAGPARRRRPAAARRAQRRQRPRCGGHGDVPRRAVRRLRVRPGPLRRRRPAVRHPRRRRRGDVRRRLRPPARGDRRRHRRRPGQRRRVGPGHRRVPAEPLQPHRRDVAGVRRCLRRRRRGRAHRDLPVRHDTDPRRHRAS